MRTGAIDYLTKPFTLDELAAVLERAAERRSINLASCRLREKPRTSRDWAISSAAARRLRSCIAFSPGCTDHASGSDSGRKRYG